MAVQRHLELVVPGLLGPVTDPDAVARLRPELPALAWLLARSDPAPATAPESLAPVFDAFGVPGPDWPAAAPARLGEADGNSVDPGDRWWVRADPVHLRVDTTHARLFGAWALDLQPDESAALIERLNELYAGDGLVFEAPAPDRWYIGCPQVSDLRAVTPDRVAGRNVDAFMPEGDDARAWRAWLNEVQMLLHDAPVNAARERRGALPVNSVWLWGGGQCPTVAAAPDYVYADEPVALGLARLAGTPAAAVDAAPWAGEWAGGSTLAVDVRARDPLVHGEIEGWLECLGALERDRIAPVARALQAGQLDTLTIAPGDGRRFRVTRRGLRRFWRRSRPWTDWLGTDT
ncbi:MAG: hypothetical protein U5K73_06750 [Halofilum sp. (in: g-proteobacteria)]|nr:hypothetical protein [Halofilum sp. (in: g-proteobacteria)]